MKEFKNETKRHRLWREHLSESHIGLVSPNKDRKFSIIHRKNLSKSHKGLPSPYKGRKSSNSTIKKLKLAWVERRKIPVSAETSRKLTSHMNKQWAIATDEQKERRLRNWMKGCNAVTHKYPTKSEKYLNILLRQRFLNEWKYVGDGEFILGGKCPDFMNCNGKKLLIELFEESCHKGQTGQNRIDHFARYGFKTLIIRENELRHSDLIVGKIHDFMLNSMQKEGANNTG